MIAKLFRRWRDRAARRRLDQIVRQKRDSYEVRRYCERRGPALKGKRARAGS